MATMPAHHQAHRHDLQAVIDAGGVHPRISCVAAPLLISPRDVAAVWLVVASAARVPEPVAAATRRPAGRIVVEVDREDRGRPRSPRTCDARGESRSGCLLRGRSW